MSGEFSLSIFGILLSSSSPSPYLPIHPFHSNPLQQPSPPSTTITPSRIRTTSTTQSDPTTTPSSPHIPTPTAPTAQPTILKHNRTSSIIPAVFLAFNHNYLDSCPPPIAPMRISPQTLSTVHLHNFHPPISLPPTLPPHIMIIDSTLMMMGGTIPKQPQPRKAKISPHQPPIHFPFNHIHWIGMWLG